MRRSVLALGFMSCLVSIYAQKPMSIKMQNPVICYAAEKNNPLTITPPEAYLRWKTNSGARIKTSTIEVDYVGFESVPQAQAAFQAAIDIWESLITSPVPIKVEAHWTTLSPGALGGAIYTSAFANFTGAQKLNVFYPVAIAEKITGQNLNGDEPDIFAQFSSSTNWHFDPNPGSAIPSQHFDLVTVVLHEIGHGLGFASTFDVEGTNGLYGLAGTEVPIIFDVPIQNGGGSNLIESFPSPSAGLMTQLTSTNLFFNSHSSLGAKIYAPAIFDEGSSISHLDEGVTSPPNSLMTPQIAPQERIHNPGVSLPILEDLGWSFVKINHQQFPGSENVNGSYPIIVSISPDEIGYDENSVTLHYTLDGVDFTSIPMEVTGTPNEFSANIPSTGVARDYGYYISVTDQSGREFVNPGKFVRENETQLQHFFVFETGPDSEAPKIVHTPKGFILEADTELVIDARITDNLGIESVMVDYYQNDNQIGSVAMLLSVPEEDSIYSVSLDLTALNLEIDDQLKYRIVATDVAVIGNPEGNIGYSPSSTGFHIINVVGLEPTQDSYSNDFNSVTDDFFGNGFSVATPSGFSDGAIHSDHPYLEGNGQPGDQVNLIYQLKIPIRVKAAEATIKFDEIVLVEPGEAGSVFGDDDFWDFVIVEGSTDGGITWVAIAPGYDARANSAWLTRYNSAINENNISTAVGEPTLFRSRVFDLLQEFNENDEVVIRFRLFSDPFAAGWGWAIDNLKIQIDDIPPVILHNHIDYLRPGEELPVFNVSVNEPNEFGDVVLTFQVNTDEITGTVTASNVTSGQTIPFVIPIDPLAEGDVLEYSITTTDASGNTGTFPAEGLIKVPVINFDAPVSTYSNNFNAASDDFVGNFFSITQPSGFANGAIHSNHPYTSGIGLEFTSNFSYTLIKPVTIATENSILRFDEIVLVEGHAGGIVFGNPLFKDYVIVEGSKDEGETWLPFLDGYDAVAQSAWLAAFNSQGMGTPALFSTRGIDLTESGDFIAGDDVLIRFRLFSNETVTGWGWAIDNLYIQDPITSTEKELEAAISVFPNPAKENIYIKAEGLSSPYFTIQLMNAQGQAVYAVQEEGVNGKMNHTISTQALPQGFYFVKISNAGSSIMRKVIKLN